MSWEQRCSEATMRRGNLKGGSRALEVRAEGSWACSQKVTKMRVQMRERQIGR